MDKHRVKKFSLELKNMVKNKPKFQKCWKTVCFLHAVKKDILTEAFDLQLMIYFSRNFYHYCN